MLVHAILCYYSAFISRKMKQVNHAKFDQRIIPYYATVTWIFLLLVCWVRWSLIMSIVCLLNKFVEKIQAFQTICFIQVGSKQGECPSFVLELKQIIIESK